MSAVADVQNTIVKAYENDPRVVVAVLSHDSNSALTTFWSNLYLRGQVLSDPGGSVAIQHYNHPWGGIPTRGWVIAPDQTIVMSILGYDPTLVSETIDEILADMEHPADLDGDGAVNGSDLGLLLGAWGPCEDCRADLDGNDTVDGADLGILLAAWST